MTQTVSARYQGKQQMKRKSYEKCTRRSFIMEDLQMHICV